ncbi:uncharacterized protein LOC107263983 [Cephus cinctus]|uniref:Uncharacterized protein LOC107263983 n=1 Tax=Cephus cinctus TaxID=211228 RepID=A0AAJ7BIZ2_CEPCN|nr:uncharacterized protein LOC107263983 [Cephus cinctus]
MDVFRVQNPALLQAIVWGKNQFESTITRGFTNEAVRRSIRHNATVQYPIRDVFFNVANTHVELTDLNLLREPNFRFTAVNSNLELLSLDVKIDVGNLQISGKFFVNNQALNNLLPISTTGNLQISCENVKAEGLIGMYPIEDSFLTNNYGLKYTAEKVIVKILYQNNDKEVNVELDKDRIEETIAAQLWMDLSVVLSKTLKKYLDEVIVELSVCELLQGEEELVDSLKSHKKAISVVANDIFDKIIANANNRINELNSAQISAPDINASFTRNVAAVTTTGRFEARNGWFRNLATLRRNGDVTVSLENNSIVILGTVGLNELKIGYDQYSAKFMDVGPTGSIETTVGSNAALFKFVIEKSEDGVSVRLAEFKITDISKIEAHVTGLGGLNWLASKISTWTAGTLRWNIAPVVEENIKRNVNDVLKNFQVDTILKK